MMTSLDTRMPNGLIFADLAYSASHKSGFVFEDKAVA